MYQKASLPFPKSGGKGKLVYPASWKQSTQKQVHQEEWGQADERKAHRPWWKSTPCSRHLPDAPSHLYTPQLFLCIYYTAFVIGRIRGTRQLQRGVRIESYDPSWDQALPPAQHAALCILSHLTLKQASEMVLVLRPWADRGSWPRESLGDLHKVIQLASGGSDSGVSTLATERHGCLHHFASSQNHHLMVLLLAERKIF